MLIGRMNAGVEPLDRDVMKKPPRDPRKPVFTPIMILSIIVSAFLMVVGTLTVFYAFLEVRHDLQSLCPLSVRAPFSP
jgi:magnesium-transporting ATPase (P-type)